MPEKKPYTTPVLTDLGIIMNPVRMVEQYHADVLQEKLQNQTAGFLPTEAAPKLNDVSLEMVQRHPRYGEVVAVA